MKRNISTLCLVAAAVALSGCYYDPGYSYVRSTGVQGDVYYGRSAPVYYDDYYAAPYYDGYYGCCYTPGVTIGISRTWHGGARYRPEYRDRWQGSRARGGDRRDGHRGDHRGSHGSDHREHGRRHHDSDHRH